MSRQRAAIKPVDQLVLQVNEGSINFPQWHRKESKRGNRYSNSSLTSHIRITSQSGHITIKMCNTCDQETVWNETHPRKAAAAASLIRIARKFWFGKFVVQHLADVRPSLQRPGEAFFCFLMTIKEMHGPGKRVNLLISTQCRYQLSAVFAHSGAVADAKKCENQVMWVWSKEEGCPSRIDREGLVLNPFWPSCMTTLGGIFGGDIFLSRKIGPRKHRILALAQSSASTLVLQLLPFRTCTLSIKVGPQSARNGRKVDQNFPQPCRPPTT